ncbi:MAG: TonB-dependent receptor [Muribaculaceae bacterium]|nr:TonB-dependent receptor [Muribaculaceae bacterium]
MNVRIKHIVPLLLVMFSVATAYAGNIFGRVVDSEKEPLLQASVRLLAAKDSAYVKGGATDEQGRFRFNNVKSGKYIIQATYVGYESTYKNITVGADNLRVGEIVMNESSIMLKETTVVGVKTPIKVMEDTVEYNADTYKTQPNAVVEDLLKRMSGVEVGSDGKITAHGKEVTKILVDGKEFFSDDPKVASKNLPASMIDKLQVIDRKSDLARLTGVDDGEDETVINLTVKKGMKNGWFGTVDAGYGTDDHYKGIFNVNRFWNDNQITFLGNVNNVNEMGFADGGMNFRRFGGDNGITSSQAFGVNFNVGNKEIFRVGGDVMYSHSDRYNEQSTNRQYLYTDITSMSNMWKESRDNGHNIRGGFRLQWNPDSSNTFEFRPNFSVNLNKSWSNDNSSTNTIGKGYTLDQLSENPVNSNGSSYNVGGSLVYNHNFKSRPGRSFSFQGRYQFSNTSELERTLSINKNTYSYDDNSTEEDDLNYAQYADNHTWNNMAQGRITWTEPLGDAKNGNFLTFAYRAQYRWNNADKYTYSAPQEALNDIVLSYLTDDKYSYKDLESLFYGYDFVANDSLTNRFRNEYFNQDIRVGYKKVSKAYTLDAGLSLVPTMQKSENLSNPDKTIPESWVWNVAPFVRYRLKMSKSRSLNVNYMGRSSQPSMAQIQPVPDYSDPLNVVIGNPELKPTFAHNVNVRFQDFNMEAQRSIMLMGFVRYNQNSIVSKTSFDPETGGRVTNYTNENGVWNARLMNMISMPLRNKAFSFSNHLFGFYSATVGYNNAERNRSGSFMVGESFSFAWRPDYFEFELRPSYNLQIVRNTVQKTSDRNVHTYGGTFNATYNAPFGLSVNSELTYSGYQGYTIGEDDPNQWLWNASIGYSFLKGRAATVSLKAFDLLQQKVSIRRNVTANYIDDTEYNTLTRYFMINFTYKFNTFGAGEQPKDRNERRFPSPPPGMHR